MWLLLLEAGVALFLLVFIVWWTMSGKKPDHSPIQDKSSETQENQSEPKQD